MNQYDEVLEEGFFKDHEVKRKWVLFVPLRRFSVTAVAIGISTFSVALWLTLATWHVFRLSSHNAAWQMLIDHRYVLAYSATLVFCLLITAFSYRKS